ncbi:CDP-alcohol phosphatidyltransferase family protein [Hoyosella rhizosphaerae]|uniref:Membrane protein n=1 Tax=Hoyosella rhizosphaerae TaxID=1755582 RepID=A0A916U731_9ACTN|nr:CDP-alcohol phosphatidyltransferase family protein [Hoyosella rhizosphaerae]MBN4927648.1 CDP-alcohol phosphatidyltransferase family protein [Hoyosella rhizosphaerae]GGC62781.1 membrane protein [Hoyosella rhizosphaerae]
MFDAQIREKLEQPLAVVAAYLDRSWITPDRITTVGLTLGLGSAVTAALQWWTIALLLWLASRIADGLDGPLARRRAARTGHSSGAGGFYDITADFVVYGSTVVGVAIGVGIAYDAPMWPFLLVLLAYYINGAAFLAFSSIAERYDRTLDDGRSLSFLGGLAEGAETIVVHSLWLLFPMLGWYIAVVWAIVVGTSAAHRIIAGYHALR